MKKITLLGDGVLSGPTGFGDTLINLLIARRPDLPLQSFQFGQDGSTLASMLRDAPFHIIGKAPDVVVLGGGYSDLAAGTDPLAAVKVLEDLTALLLSKTAAVLCIANLAEAFLSGREGLPDAAGTFNRALSRMPAMRVKVLDLDARARSFLERHREGPGEKRALHNDWNRLTGLGRLLLAEAAYAEVAPLLTGPASR